MGCGRSKHFTPSELSSARETVKAKLHRLLLNDQHLPRPLSLPLLLSLPLCLCRSLSVSVCVSLSLSLSLSFDP